MSIPAMKHGGLGIVIAIAASLASGCTVIRIQTPDAGEVDVKRHFGLTSILVAPSKGAVVVDSTSLGAINSIEGIAVGYHSASWAAVAADRCQLVVWIRTDEELRNLKEFLLGQADACAFRPGQ